MQFRQRRIHLEQFRLIACAEIQRARFLLLLAGSPGSPVESCWIHRISRPTWRCGWSRAASAAA